MDNPSDILKRLNLELLHNNVVFGREERGEPDPRSYDERLSKARQQALDRITETPAQPEEALQDLLDTAKDVYTAIGMKAGAELAGQKLRHERLMRDRTPAGSAEKEACPPPDMPLTTPPETPPEKSLEMSPETPLPPPPEEFTVLRSRDAYARVEARLNLQALGEYIRNGSTRSRLYEKPFQERLEEASRALEARTLSLAGGPEAATALNEVAYDYAEVSADVHFSLGMKAGARLNALLTADFDRDY